MPQKAQKKIPIRRCVGCGEGKPKKELVRVVRSAEGEVSLDLTGRKAGRGAYLCRNAACLQKAQKRRSLQRSFSAEVPDDVFDTLGKALAESDEMEGCASTSGGFAEQNTANPTRAEGPQGARGPGRSDAAGEGGNDGG